MIFRIDAIRLPALCAIRCRQPDADSAFIDLEAQATLLIIVGLLTQLRELGGIGQQPLFQFCVVCVDLRGGVTVMSKNLSNSYHC